jgi:putative transposase
MPRKLRPQEAHLTLHITAHATGKRLCFPDDGARAMFRGIIVSLQEDFPIELHAFALMSNHVHLLLTSRKDNCGAQFMKHLLATHAVSMNRLDGYSGQMWQDRYHSVVVNTESHALHSCLYIDANPWRANLVEHPLESSWTSHRELVHGHDASFLTPHAVLLDLGNEGHWRMRYNEIMAEYLVRGSRTCCRARRISKVDPLAGLQLKSWKL